MIRTRASTHAPSAADARVRRWNDPPTPLCRAPEPTPPPPRGRAGDPHLRRDVRDRTPRPDALDHDQPAGRSQPGVSVGHERPPWTRGNLVLRVVSS